MLGRSMPAAILVSTLVSTLALAAGGCRNRVERIYYEDAYAELTAEPPVRASGALAREVAWVYEIVAPGSDVRMVSGSLPSADEHRSTAEVFAERARQLDGMADAVEDENEDAASTRRKLAHAFRQAAERSRRFENTVEPAWSILYPAAATPPDPKAAAAAQAIEFQMQQLVQRALVEPGFIGPSAPAGTVLVINVFGTRNEADDFRGYEGVIGTLVDRVSPASSLRAIRGYRSRAYRRAPDPPPEGFLDLAAEGLPKGTQGIQLSIHAAMVRSAALELELALLDIPED